MSSFERFTEDERRSISKKGGHAAAAARVPKSARCDRCHLRWKQEDGLCRSCRREVGDLRSTSELQHVHARHQPAGGRPLEYRPYERPPIVTRDDRGREIVLEVVYDGRHDYR